MARNRAMAGPGSRKMGGAGIKAGAPHTPMAGSGIGASRGSPAAAMGAPPMAPKVAGATVPRIGAGAPPPMPGGGIGAPPAGPPPTPPGGMGGAGGFAAGGAIPDTLPVTPSAPAYRKGGSVGGDTKPRHKGKSHK